MVLTPLEREFLERLSSESWVSPPLFDHSLLARLVENGLIRTQPVPSGQVQYDITEAGITALSEDG